LVRDVRNKMFAGVDGPSSARRGWRTLPACTKLWSVALAPEWRAHGASQHPPPRDQTAFGAQDRIEEVAARIGGASVSIQTAAATNGTMA
jgi:hypothetical protein